MRRSVVAVVALLLVTLGMQPAAAATYYVDHPFTKDSIPYYNATGRSNVPVAVDRWDDLGGLNLWPTTANPSSGIDVRWGSTSHPYYNKKIGGWVEATWVWSSGQWEIKDCTVFVNRKVYGAGQPYGRWLEAIVSHEVGHCLGWWRDGIIGYPSIMRSGLSKSGTLAGIAYRPTNDDRRKIIAGLATN